MSAPRATYQLSLLGDPPRKGREWKPVLWRWTFGGIPIDPPPVALRQAEMLTRETRQDDDRSGWTLKP